MSNQCIESNVNLVCENNDEKTRSKLNQKQPLKPDNKKSEVFSLKSS